MPRRDLPEEIWVVEVFKAQESRSAGYAFGRVKLKGDAENVARYRRKLKRRIRSINLRRLELLAESMPNRGLAAENEILQARLEELEAMLRDRGQIE